MTNRVLTLDKDKTVLDAVKLMDDVKIGSLVVIETDKPVGIITERDVLSKVVAKELQPASLHISEIMSSPIISIEANKTVSEAIEIMGKKGIKHLVVRDRGKVVGMFSLTNITDLGRYRLGIEQ